LLRDGHVNLAARNGDGLTALLVAARLREHEAAEIIRLLTDAGASVDDIDRLGRGALHLAALAGNPATTRVLLQRGADPSRVDARRGATPAHYAAAFARVDAMAMLCAHDAKAVRDARDRLGRSPLHWSALSAHRPWASQGSLRVADELLAAGASPRARDRTGATPAHAAARLGADAWLDQLAKRDTGLLDERDNRGVSPLDMLETRYRKTRLRSRFAFDGFSLQIRLPRPFSRD
jgi:ankyrin repeat protein